MKHFFHGGIHPHYRKELSIQTAEISVVTPEQLVIPLQQHIGEPCKPLVTVGEPVLLGQKIGDHEGLCVPVHASASGRVVAIEPRPHTSGKLVEAVVIENDFQDTAIPPSQCDLPTHQLEGDQILHQIREAGIVGMGGAAFPGSVKALSAMGKVDTLIANGCECEPYITADDALLRTAPDQVLEGIDLMGQVLSPDRIVLAVEDNKQIALQQLRPRLEAYPKIELAVLPTRYPQGSEKQLIQAVTGRQVPPGGLPVQAKCAVFNVSTFAAIFRAVRQGMPLVRRILTVSGEAVAKPQNFIVPIGTPFRDVIHAAGGLLECADRVISGGPMMGLAQSDLSVPVIKATNSILCMPKDTNGPTEHPVCLRCAKCVAVCPMHLQPLYLYRFQLAGKKTELLRLNITDCIECGCCSFICPGKLPLVERFRLGKKQIKEALKT